MHTLIKEKKPCNRLNQVEDRLSMLEEKKDELEYSDNDKGKKVGTEQRLLGHH
jgi:hypothetical protein